MKKIGIILVVALLTACASYGTKINSDYVSKIKKGETTEKEIVANLGNPMSVGLGPDGQKFLMYMHTYSQAKAATFIPIVGAFAGGADTSTQMLQLWVDANGVVTNFAYTDSQSEMGMGISATK